jgi:hypothetical protein
MPAHRFMVFSGRSSTLLPATFRFSRTMVVVALSSEELILLWQPIGKPCGVTPFQSFCKKVLKE